MVSDENESRRALTCIGSFKAFTQDNETYTIEIWTHYEAVHDRDRSRVEEGMIVLKTRNGEAVERIDQGEYRLKSNPEITFSTDDPDAP